MSTENIDLLINIEASHTYPSRIKFFAEAFRVLAPGGRMLYTDLFLGQQRVVQTQKDLLSAGFKVRRQTDVTKAVMRSIQKNTGHFYRLLENASKSKEAKDFAFRLASQDYPAFAKRYQNRQLIYNVWILEKPKISV